MMYSYRIEQALRAAAILHQDQVRKGSAPYPYIVHPFVVALLLGDYTDSEELIMAGLLHDTLEHTDYTAKELEGDFGRQVRELVEAVTPPRSEDGQSWKKGRELYLAHIQEASDEALILIAADATHNMRSIVEEYHAHPERFSSDFGGTLEERMLAEQKLSNLLNRRVKNRIIHEFNHVFDEYKKFIEHANSAKKTS